MKKMLTVKQKIMAIIIVASLMAFVILLTSRIAKISHYNIISGITQPSVNHNAAASVSHTKLVNQLQKKDASTRN